MQQAVRGCPGLKSKLFGSDLQVLPQPRVPREAPLISLDVS